jgi:glycosyltransferase involved in cell wall biosynthesis
MERADEPLGRPIRVVLLTSGPSLDPGARELLVRLEAHPDVDVVAVLWESAGTTASDVLRDLWRRRRWLAPLVFALDRLRLAARWLRAPRRELRGRRALRGLAERIRVVPDLHDPRVAAELAALQPDLGLSYGSPILRPAIFSLPSRGSLGIHHGRLPAYRGKKTAFWAMLRGESEAGVTIQRLNAKLDGGEIVREGAVAIGRRSHGAVWRRLEALGLDLYLEAILAVGDGTARFEPPRGTKGPLFRDPTARDLARYAVRLPGRLLRGTGRNAEPSRGSAARRITIVTETYLPEVGGGETQARALAEGLAAGGAQVRLLTRRSRSVSPRREVVGGVAIRRLPPPGRGPFRKWLLALPVGWSLLRLGRDSDAVLVCGFRILGIPAVPIARAFGIPCILKADSVGEMSGSFFDAGLARVGLSRGSAPVRAALALRHRVLRRADAFVAISSVIERELREAGIAPERIRRIPNGIDPLRFAPAAAAERAQLRERLGLPVEARVVVYTGRLVRTKGLLPLLEAWRGLVATRPDAHLVLVGAGGLDMHACEEELRAFVEEHGLGASVQFAGAVDDVSGHLRAADVFAFPSEDEAFGLSLAEAMACGLACASTDVGGLSDLLRDGENGLRVAAGSPGSLQEALGQLLDDPERRAALGREARRDALARYAIEEVVTAYERLLARGAVRTA